MDRFERAMRFAEIHAQARKQAGKSQEYMALELNISKKTVQNWESGASCPDLFSSLEWFRALNVNPIPYLARVIYDYDLEDDGNVDEQFAALSDTLSEDTKKAILYIMHGNHGGDPKAIFQLILAHLSTPIATRVTRAFLVSLDYEMQTKLGTTKTEPFGKPDIDYLNEAIYSAQDAVIEHRNTYEMVDKARRAKK